jgi:hypothetical protein
MHFQNGFVKRTKVGIIHWQILDASLTRSQTRAEARTREQNWRATVKRKLSQCLALVSVEPNWCDLSLLYV